MATNITEIFMQFAIGAGKTALIMTAILMPLMIALEIIKDARILERAARFVQPVMRLFNLPKEGAFPMLAGIFFGISLGSGVIIQYSEEGSLSRRDLTLIGIFLAICHGMVEDPLIFTAVGAEWWIIVSLRVVLSIATIMILSRLLRVAPAINSPATPDEYMSPSLEGINTLDKTGVGQ